MDLLVEQPAGRNARGDAAQFDPQRFHLDEEEGRKSLFGGLAASGWHVAAVCMKLLVADGKRLKGRLDRQRADAGLLTALEQMMPGATTSPATAIPAQAMLRSRSLGAQLVAN